MNTKASEVIDFFESSFQDKREIPIELELVWLKRAIGDYSYEIEELNYDSDIQEFDCELDSYVISTLANKIRVYYQEREVSRINKQISIVGKDISIDGAGHTKTASKNELDYFSEKDSKMIDNQKKTAYDD